MTANLLRQDHLPKLAGQARRALIREAAKTSMLALEKLQRFTAQVGESVPWTTINHALYKSGFYESVARRKPYEVLFSV